MRVGYNGHSWSSATSGIFGLDMNFGTTWFLFHTPDHRACGFQLRCLSE
ncbi:hypothetical protein [uncultured Rikenella sp.]|nr:hypothetical protein [uncultured Rikenella sp.]